MGSKHLCTGSALKTGNTHLIFYFLRLYSLLIFYVVILHPTLVDFCYNIYAIEHYQTTHLVLYSIITLDSFCQIMHIIIRSDCSVTQSEHGCALLNGIMFLSILLLLHCHTISRDTLIRGILRLL